MTARLPIASADVARVAELAQVGVATVRRYRATWDGTPRYQLRRAQEAAITRAAAELPPVAQVELPVVEQIPSEPGRQPAKRLSRVSPTMGQPGEVRSCPVSPRAHQMQTEHRTLTSPAGRSATIPKHCRVTVLDEHGQVILP